MEIDEILMTEGFTLSEAMSAVEVSFFSIASSSTPFDPSHLLCTVLSKSRLVILVWTMVLNYQTLKKSKLSTRYYHYFLKKFVGS